MNPKTRHSKSPYVLIGVGFALGAVSMTGFFSNALARPAYAGPDVHARVVSGVTAENMAALRNLDESYANLAEFTGPAVVEIRATSDVTKRGPNGERTPLMGGSGSGFIFRPDGWIVTNDHVVGGFDKVQVVLKDGRTLDGKVIRAEDTDIAVVKVEAKDLPTLAVADSSKVRAGQTVMAVGAPFGLDQSYTFGHVSAIGRLQGIQGRVYPDLIQTDAAINVGNSGGPLVNIDGQVVGVNTAIFTTTGGSAGVGFAIPGNQARFIAEALINKGKITRSMIGLVPENLKDYQKKEKGLEGGALVVELSSDGPAAAAGIKKDDVIVKIGTTPIHTQMDLRNAMLVYAPGTTVPVELIRNGKNQTINVKLVKKPAAPAAKRLPMDDGDFSMPKDFDPKDMPKGFDRFFKNFQEEQDGAPRTDQRDDVPAIRDGQARLGVSVSNPTEELRKEYKIPADQKGVVVVDVQPGSVAAKNQLREGDVIVTFNGKKIETPEDLTREVSATKWGQKREIETKRFTNGTIEAKREIEFK